MASTSIIPRNRRYLTDESWVRAGELATLPDHAFLSEQIPISSTETPEQPKWNVLIEPPTTQWFPSSWWEPTCLQAFSLLDLPENWDSYGARRIERDCVIEGLNFLVSVLDDETAPPSVVPSSHGGIQFEWHKSGLDLEIEVTASKRVSIYIHDHATGKEWEADQPTGVLTEAVKRLRE